MCMMIQGLIIIIIIIIKCNKVIVLGRLRKIKKAPANTVIKDHAVKLGTPKS
jgi:hypothetical protein